MGRGAWQVIVHGVAKRRIQLSMHPQTHTHTHTHTHSVILTITLEHSFADQEDVP